MIRICTQADFASKIAQDWILRYRNRKPFFACILSFTDTGLQPQISAAGTTQKARRTTALADGEYLHSGANYQYPLPPLPAGVSPAVITRAILTYCDIPLQLLSTGLPSALCVPHILLPTVLAKDLSTGAAMSVQQATQLFNSGYEQGQQLGSTSPNSYWIVSESVVGGTTTAQAVLTALGYQVAGKMSSSHLVSNHQQKQALVQAGIQRWRSRHFGSSTSPLEMTRFAIAHPIEAAAALGDPMQLVAAGMMLSISQSAGVLLAGGAQMLAVYALARAIAQAQNILWNPHQVVVGTTRWVIEDTSADTISIAQALQAPYIASQLSFARSPYVRLRAYEQGFVKEGTGAGGCAIAAHLYQNATSDRLRHAIEAELRQL